MVGSQGRFFLPQSHLASPSLGPLNTPWYIDYGHLVFWFYFLASFVVTMWLVTCYVIFTRNVEMRAPIRETRGFSRAQTGDGLTAVLPMTWSITMLMHASTHSSNFDENTAGTLFSVSVIAYQWGWNYYFPRDVIEIFSRAPKVVGHGGIERGAGGAYQDLLHERARQDYLGRVGAGRTLASKWGRSTAPTPLTLLGRPQPVSLLSQVPLVGLGVGGLDLRHNGPTSQRTKGALAIVGNRLGGVYGSRAQRSMGLVDWREGVATKVRAALGSREALASQPYAPVSPRSWGTQAWGSANLSPSYVGPEATASWGVPLFKDWGLGSRSLRGLWGPQAGPRAQAVLGQGAEFSLGAELGSVSPLVGDDMGAGVSIVGRELEGLGNQAGPTGPVPVLDHALRGVGRSLSWLGGSWSMSKESRGGWPGSTSDQGMVSWAQALGAGHFGLGPWALSPAPLLAKGGSNPGLTLSGSWSPSSSVFWAQANPSLGLGLRPLPRVGVAIGPRAEGSLSHLHLLPSLTHLPLGYIGSCEWVGSWAPSSNPVKPVRVGQSNIIDPSAFNAKALAPGLIKLPLLQAWATQWSRGLVGFSRPLGKVSRGSMVQGGGWGSESWNSDPEVQGLLWRPSETSPFKGAVLYPLPRFAKATNVGQSPRLDLVIGDGERASLVRAYATPTPAAYEDLDMAFVNNYWAAEINAVRRGDHGSKYAHAWGPWGSSPRALGASPSQSLGSLAGGPSTSVGLTTAPSPSLWASLSALEVSGSLYALPPESLSQVQWPLKGLVGSLGGLVSIGVGAPVLEAWSKLGSEWGTRDLGTWALLGVGTQGVFSKARGGYEALSTSSAISRRLRVSRGICLPSDCPMHFICGSRDVIHSWAIPGLGIKIDCVPGYNSHRRVLLRWRGIYWGQCMEVCGRYHHWMPILVHVTHKDIFLSWCVAYLGLLVHAKPSPSALGEDWLKAGGLDAVRGALGR